MTVGLSVQLDSGGCLDCDSPEGGFICEACAKDREEERGPIAARRIIDRWSYTRRVTNAEKELLEELVGELEAGK